MPLLLIFGFIALELWLIIAAGERFGAGPVLLWLLGAAMLGMALIARGGAAAMRRAQASMSRGELPAAELFEALIGAIAGVLLVLPGFITDVMAVVLLIAGTILKRRIARLLIAQVARARPDLRQPVTLEGEIVRRGPPDEPPRLN
jgi:UPF0716 protein FxsA